jgi:hypothetical protein
MKWIEGSGWSATWGKKELAGTSCMQINDLASSHFAWAAKNYQDVQGNARKLKEWGIKKPESDRKLQHLTWEKAGSTRIHGELGGNDRKGWDYKGHGGI